MRWLGSLRRQRLDFPACPPAEGPSWSSSPSSRGGRTRVRVCGCSLRAGKRVDVSVSIGKAEDERPTHGPVICSELSRAEMMPIIWAVMASFWCSDCFTSCSSSSVHAAPRCAITKRRTKLCVIERYLYGTHLHSCRKNVSAI